LLVKLHVNVTLISCSLSLEAANALLDFFLNMSELVDSFDLGCFDVSVDLVVESLVLDGHLVLYLSNLNLDDLVGLFNLEVSDLSN
jgi:hypothetical protein